MASFRFVLSLVLGGASASLALVACARNLDNGNGGFGTVDSRKDSGGTVDDDDDDGIVPGADGGVIPGPGSSDGGSDANRDGATSADGGACVAADGGTLDFVLTTVGEELSKPVVLPASPTLAPFTSPGVCPITAGLGSTQRPFQAFRVQNRTGKTTSLSAWAVCSGADTDMFLAVYKGSTMPLAEAERRACPAGTVLSNGKSSFPDGGYDSPSPESGASNYCPSLLKSRGHALSLAPCEEAVLYLQSYYDTTPDAGRPLPSVVKVKAE
ncbi:MAG: hypothetical protein U0169_03420 [Polyangiaceae bacterium]